MNLKKFFGAIGADTDQVVTVLAQTPKRCYDHDQDDPCPDCAADKARGYTVRVLAGRCANGSELGGGARWHAVQIGEHGMDWTAMCGAKPGRRSAGWSRWIVRGQAVTCPRCAKKLEAK